jgi:hypothetical protein
MLSSTDIRDTRLLDLLPTPQVIRGRLGRILREADILKRLLRLSERAAEEKRLTEESRP